MISAAFLELLLRLVAIVLALLAAMAHHERANGLLSVAFALYLLSQVLPMFFE